MELTQKPRQGTCQDPFRLTINDLPDELLVEIFYYCRRDKVQDTSVAYEWWSMKYGWFKLIHVCKRWRTVMFASPSRLDLCLVLSPHKGGNMKTILSRHFPSLPIDINYKCLYRDMTAKDTGRMLSALKRPDRIRGIALSGTIDNFNKLFKATKCLPALESLELRGPNCGQFDSRLTVPTSFLKGSNLHLRSLKMYHIPSPFILRLLSSAKALTSLSLRIAPNVGPPPVMSTLLSHLRGMRCLRLLDLALSNDIDYQTQPTEHKKNFRLSNLKSFCYRGHSAHLNTLVAGFAAPSLRKVDVELSDTTPPHILYLFQFIENIGENYHAVKVVLEKDYFRLLFFSRTKSEYHSLRFALCSRRFPESIMQTCSVFSTKLNIMTELHVTFLHNDDASEDFIPWRTFLLQFPSVKALRIEGTNHLRIASVLHEDDGELNFYLLPSLEEIQLCTGSFWAHKDKPGLGAREIAAFQPFVSARQQANHPVRVFWGPPIYLAGRHY